MKQIEFMSQEAINKTKNTRFKKGNRPHNWKPVGSTRLDTDGYVMIKTKEPNVFELKHRVTWEKHNGPIPEGMLIQFKDGDRTNTDDINNLYIISRKEQMIENHGPLNLSDASVAIYLSGGKKSTKEAREVMLEHPKLIELKRTQLLLNRQIENYEKSKY